MILAGRVLLRARRGMKKLNILLVNSSRDGSNVIEALVRDVCYNRAIVECTRTARVDEFLRMICCEWLDLIIMPPDNLLPGTNHRRFLGSMAEAIRAVQAIRNQC